MSTPGSIARRVTAAAATLAVVVAGGLGLAGCGDDEPETDANTSSTGGDDTGGDETAAPPDGSSYDDLDALTAALTDAGFTCVLDYEGLEDDGKTVSLCTLVPPSGGAGSQATLTIWDDPERVAEFASSGAPTELTVYGANWTMDLRDAEVATTVAEALDGQTG